MKDKTSRTWKIVVEVRRAYGHERGRVFVNRLSDGAPVGTFEPGPTVGGAEKTGLG